MKLLSAFVALGLAFASHSAFAQKKQSLHDQFTGQGYGMAGCGLGSVVFGDKPGMIQIVAATLNAVSGNQTFGITFGTSNCGESGKAARANQFIEVNKVALENDLSRGAGESIVALSEVMGCKNPDFTVQLKSQYSAGASQEALVSAASKSCQL
jgi:hypothetical protein